MTFRLCPGNGEAERLWHGGCLTMGNSDPSEKAILMGDDHANKGRGFKQ